MLTEPVRGLWAPSPPHLLAVVRVIAEAQATVVGDLRQVFIVKFFQTYVLGRPGEETRSESKDRAPETASNPGCPARELVLGGAKGDPATRPHGLHSLQPKMHPAITVNPKLRSPVDSPANWSYEQPEGLLVPSTLLPGLLRQSQQAASFASMLPPGPSGSQPHPQGSQAEQSRGEGELKLQQRGRGESSLFWEQSGHFVSPLQPKAGLHPEVQPCPHHSPFPQGSRLIPSLPP